MKLYTHCQLKKIKTIDPQIQVHVYGMNKERVLYTAKTIKGQQIGHSQTGAAEGVTFFQHKRVWAYLCLAKIDC